MAKRKLIINTAIYSVGELFPKLISFVLLPVFTTYLSTEDYGIISYTNSIMQLLQVVCTLSLNTYLLRMYFEYKMEEERKLLIGNVFSTMVVFNLMVLGVGLSIGPYLANATALQIPFHPFISLTLLNTFLEVFAIVPLIIYRVKENAKFYVTINIVRSILIFLVTYFLIVKLNWGILGNFYGRLYINAIFTFIYIGVIYRSAKFNLNLERIKKSLAFSLPLIPGAIGYLLIIMADRIILERYVSLSELGIYSVAYTISLSLTVFVQSGYRAFEPEIFRKYNQSSFDSFIVGLHNILMFGVFVGASTLTIFSKDILEVMTKGDFIKGYTLIPVFLIGVIATAQNSIFGAIAIAEKRTKLSGLATTLGGIASVLFNLLFVPRFGIYSAAFASTLGYIIINLIIYSGIRIKMKEIRYDIQAILIFFVLAIGIISLDNDALSLSSILIKMVILFAFVYIFALTYKINFKQIAQLISDLGRFQK